MIINNIIMKDQNGQYPNLMIPVVKGSFSIGYVSHVPEVSHSQIWDISNVQNQAVGPECQKNPDFFDFRIGMSWFFVGLSPKDVPLIGVHPKNDVSYASNSLTSCEDS